MSRLENRKSTLITRITDSDFMGGLPVMILRDKTILEVATAILRKTSVSIHGIEVHGVEVDSQTRCKHYHSAIDIIAIQFACCDTYYPCYECHQEVADHPAVRWREDQIDEKAILCGACGYELTIHEYMTSNSICPTCDANFNEGCRNHYHLYFE